MKAPNKCPMCGEKKQWVLIDKHKNSFNAAGAVAGAMVGGLAGGLIGSALGKSKKYEEYRCAKCGFSHTYEA